MSLKYEPASALADSDAAAALSWYRFLSYRHLLS